MGLEPGVAGWKVQMNPLSNGGTPFLFVYLEEILISFKWITSSFDLPPEGST